MGLQLALQLVNILHDELVGVRASSISTHLQVLIALRFFADGSYLQSLGQHYLHAVSQTTASRIIKRVARAHVRMSHDYIKFPQTIQERRDTRNRLQRVNRIQNIVGLIDCFVVKILKPYENGEAFFHYKHGSAMNVQVITDSNYLIQNVRICPGSNNDRHIWNFSEIKDYMENIRSNPQILQEEGKYYLLGDSGYASSPIMLTLILHAEEDSPESLYTSEHVRTRKVEQTFGVLTNVW